MTVWRVSENEGVLGRGISGEPQRPSTLSDFGLILKNSGDLLHKGVSGELAW